MKKLGLLLALLIAGFYGTASAQEVDTEAGAVSEAGAELVAEPAIESQPSLDAFDRAPSGRVLPTMGVPVVDVRVIGNRRIEQAAVRAAIRTEPGSRANSGVIADDIRRIYALGFFRDVLVGADSVPGGQVLTYQVIENPIIRRVTIAGNENLESKDITENLTLTLGSTIDYPQVIENKQRIGAMYQQKGYYEAEVSYVVEQLSAEAVSVDYEVAEGRKLRLVKVEFNGNEAYSDRQLMRGWETKPWGWTSSISHFWDKSGRYAEGIFFQDRSKVRERYMNNGYIRVDISEPRVEVTDDGIEVAMDISEGPQFTVGSVGIAGDSTLDRDELLRYVALDDGDVFSRGTLTDDVERVKYRFADRGFYAAEVKPRTDVDPDKLTVDILFEVDKGELFFVDWIQVAGNTRTRDKVVRRELSLDEGALYSYGAVERSKARVRRLGYFEEVNVEAEETDDGNIGVTVDVVERPTGSFSFGAGFGSVDGFLLTTAIRQDNLFGRGYSVSASVDFGGSRRFGSLRFANRALFGSPAGFSVSGNINDWEFSDFDQSVRGFSFDVSYPLDEGETRVSSGYGFSSRKIDDFELEDSASLLQREELQGNTSTSLLNFSLWQDTRDDIRFPRNGHNTSFNLEFAGLGGDSEFLRLGGRSTFYKPMKRWLGFDSTFVFNSRIGWSLPFNKVTDFDLPTCPGGAAADSPCGLALADVNLEQITALDDDLELPLSERYFLGGVGGFQLRGFEQRSVGPRRATLGSYQELPFRLRNNFSGGLIAQGACTNEFAIASTDPGEGRDFVFATAGNVREIGVDVAGGACSYGQENGLFAPATLGNESFLETDVDNFGDLDFTDVIGGNKMFLMNLELRFPISEELGLEGSFFFDMGNAFAENESINPADFRLGTGVGATWFSPFGPILLTLGIPLDPLEDEKASVFEFSLGGQSF